MEEMQPNKQNVWDERAFAQDTVEKAKKREFSLFQFK